MKHFSLFVFFCLSRKLAVFLRDYSLQHCYLMRSVREDRIFSILLILRLAAWD